MQEQQFGFEKYSAGIREALSKHAEDGTVSCLMNNHKVWKISFGVLLRWIEDFKAVKERLGLRDGDRAVVLSGNTVDAFATFLVLSANHLTAVMADAAIPDGELLPLIGHCRRRRGYDCEAQEGRPQNLYRYKPRLCHPEGSGRCAVPRHAERLAEEEGRGL